MIYYDHLPLDKDILQALGELSINYVFQPIFQADGETVFAWEALMRPTDMSVTELIEAEDDNNRLQYLTEDIPRTMIITDVKTYISSISSSVLQKRLESSLSNSVKNG